MRERERGCVREREYERKKSESKREKREGRVSGFVF